MLPHFAQMRLERLAIYPSMSCNARYIYSMGCQFVNSTLNRELTARFRDAAYFLYRMNCKQNVRGICLGVKLQLICTFGLLMVVYGYVLSVSTTVTAYMETSGLGPFFGSINKIVFP